MRLHSSTLLAALAAVLVATACAAPTFPLQTSSRWIVDANGSRVKFACVNWAGGAQKDFVAGGLDHEDVGVIAKIIAQWGFNCIRLPFSLQLVEENPVVNPARLSSNPSLVGKRALPILDAVIQACDAAGLMVILDNHMSRGDWCCSYNDGNGLWYTPDYPESSWIADLATLATRYKQQANVVGVELRNEPRCVKYSNGTLRCATWGDGNPLTDFRAAAVRAGNAVLDANPNVLVMVDGINYATDLTGVYHHPVVFNHPNRLVYVAHDYSWSQSSKVDLSTWLGDRWGYILAQGHDYTAPVWVSEFGTWHDGRDLNSTWWKGITSYLTNADIDWGYWRVDGTESNGTGRPPVGSPAGFGVFNTSWSGPAAGGVLLHALQPLQAATQGPSL